MQKIEFISIDHLHPHPDNPRKNLGDLTELVAAIKAKGILQNLTVVPYYSTPHQRIMEGLYTVIIGHRRMAAAKLAGLTEVPCVIAEMTPQEQFETMMVENIQRSDLTVYEQAEGFQLMLDMGATVEQVAQKVGLSETTVRNRAKLTRLDKDKFKKAEARGTTMTDFLKLNAIKDEARRNEVLESIGTENFNQRLKAALKKEQDEAWLAETIEAFRNADWCDELTKEQRDELNGKFIKYQHNYGTWNKRAVEKPADAGNGQHAYLYFFCVGKDQVDLYREIKKSEDTEPKIDPAEQRRREVAEGIDYLMAECDDMNQGFRDLRDDFITEFDRFDRHREEIIAFAVKAFMFRDVPLYCATTKLDWEELAGMLNIGYDEKSRKIDQEALNRELRIQPERVLLYMAYLLLEDGNRSWTVRCYDNRVRTYLPKYKPDKQLDLLYECLCSLGYEVSAAERFATGGLVPQYDEAAKLVDEYEEEIKNG